MAHVDQQKVDAPVLDTPTRVEPVRRAMTVGAAYDTAELDADRRADAALGWLAEQQPAEKATPEAHVHTSTCEIGRSHREDTTAVIGHAGGELDADTQGEIEGAIGGGETLHGSVRSTMESAFGSDFGKVRVHRGGQADRISRSISAQAFTTGNDIFFAKGAYDPDSARGQKVLAHELGHVVQGAGPAVRRLDNPFAKKTDAQKAEKASKAAEKARLEEEVTAQKMAAAQKSAKEKKAKEKAKAKANKLKEQKKSEAKRLAAERKDGIADARTTNKGDDKAARTTAKANNAGAKELTEKLKLTYQTDPTAKLLTPPDIADLQKRFQKCLQDEAAARRAVYRQHTGGAATEKTDTTIVESLAEKAGNLVWEGADEAVRLLRPLRFDDFDKALKEVNELAQEGRAEKAGQASMMLVDNEAEHGAPLDPSKASKRVLEQRDLERRRARALAKSGKADKHADKIEAGGDKAVEKAGKFHEVGDLEEASLRSGAAKKRDAEEFGHYETIGTVADGTKKGAMVAGKLGAATKGTTKGVTTVKWSKVNDGTSIGGLVGASASAFGQILTLVTDILGFATQVGEMRQGTADSGAKVKATGQVVGVLNDATKITKTALRATQAGLKAFDAGNPAFSQVGTALPIVGVITSALGLVQGALALLPTLDRHAMGVISLEEALLAGRAPLAASYDRVNSRTAQLIEKSTFGLAKNITMLGVSVAEICSGGGMGVPAAIKLGVVIVDLLHTVGHKIYDTVGESKSSTALKSFKVKHQEGASRDVLKYDVGSSVDVIIVAAKKHKLPYARMTLVEYGVKDSEIDSMWLDELREKVLDGLDAEGNRKTVTEKVVAAKDSVLETFGQKKKPNGPKDESTRLEKAAAVPGKIGGAIASLPGMVKAKIKSMKESHADAQALVANKNDQNHHGKNDRGTRSTLFYAMRGSDKNEKSFAKIRKVAADEGTDVGELPRTAADRAKRAEATALRDLGPDADISGPLRLDNAFIKEVTKATFLQLFDVGARIDQTPPIRGEEMAKLRFLEFEVAARTSAPGAKPRPGPRG